MSEKYRICNESCPGYSNHGGGWCGYSDNWGKQVKQGDVCHLEYSPIATNAEARKSSPSQLEQTAKQKEMPNPVKGLKLTLIPVINGC